MRIGIVGTGNMGEALGRIWAHRGHQITFSYSRSEAKLQALADELGASCGSVLDAVAEAEVVLLAVHWSRVEDALSRAGSLAGKIVANCCIPLDVADENLVVGIGTSGAELLAAAHPEARWVGAFNTCPSESLPLVHAGCGGAHPPQLMLYGEDDDAKAQIATLIQDVGFEPLDLGGLRNARFVEPFAMVTEVLAYRHPGGEALTYRFEKLQA
nr:NADPH-dependent F420 reductase [uncultured Cohaesibacter sp.]